MRSLPSIAVLCALSLLAACAAAPQISPGAPTPAPATDTGSQVESTSPLEKLRQSAIDFEQARATGYAVGMAQAAAERRSIDRIMRSAPQGSSASEILTSARMFAEARAVARGREKLLAEISRIESAAAASLANQILDAEGGQLMDANPEGLILERDASESARLPIPKRVLPMSKFQREGVLLRVPAGKVAILRADVQSRRTLFVYAEGKPAGAVSLAIFNADTSEQVCIDAQRHGYLLCRMRTEKAATGLVRVRNSGASEAAVLLIAHQ